MRPNIQVTGFCSDEKRVKPDAPLERTEAVRRTPLSDSPARRETPTVLNLSTRRIRTVCTVVWEGRSREAPPYPDSRVYSQRRRCGLWDKLKFSLNRCITGFDPYTANLDHAHGQTQGSPATTNLPLRPIAYYRHYGPAAWIDPVVLRARRGGDISWNNIVIPVRSCPYHGHPM